MTKYIEVDKGQYIELPTDKDAEDFISKFGKNSKLEDIFSSSNMSAPPPVEEKSFLNKVGGNLRKEMTEGLPGQIASIGYGVTDNLIPGVGYLRKQVKNLIEKQTGQKQDIGERAVREANPISETLGQAAPGLVRAVATYGGALNALPLAYTVAKGGVKGVAASTIRNANAGLVSGQAADLNLNPKTMTFDAALAGAFPAIGGIYRGAKQIAKPISEPVKQITKDIVKKAPGVSLLTEAIENYKKAKVSRKIEKATEELGEKYQAKDIFATSDDFSRKYENVRKKAGEKYRQIVDPIVDNFGKTKVSVERLRRGYIDKLKEMRLIDDVGNIKEESLALEFEEGARPMVKKLTNQINSLRQNLTLNELKEITDDIGKLAKFQSKTRPDKAKTFGKLYHEARENLLDAVEEATIKKGMSSKNVKNTIKEIEKIKRSLATINEEGAQPLIGTRYKNVLAEQRKTRRSLLTDKKNELEKTRKNIETMGEEIKENFRTARASINRVLNLGRSDIGKLAGMETEKLAPRISSKITGEGYEEAVKASSELAKPIKRLVLSDILNQLNKPGVDKVKTLSKILYDKRQVLNKLFSPEEIQALQEATNIVKPKVNSAVIDSIKKISPAMIIGTKGSIQQGE